MPRLFPGTGHDSALWPVLLLLLIVLVPSAGVVWMMRAAMQNERLAVRQRLTDAYQAQLEVAHRRIDEQWQENLSRLDSIVATAPPAQAFIDCLRSGDVDSVVILDEHGDIAYPNSAAPNLSASEPHTEWQAAERLEFSERRLDEAAVAYGKIAVETKDAAISARAYQAQARALVEAGDVPGAIRCIARHA